MLPSSQDKFIERLQREAELQAELYQTEFLPQQLRGLARTVARYPWQTALLLAILTAGILEVWR